MNRRSVRSHALVVAGALTFASAHTLAQPRESDIEAQHTQGNRLREQGRHAEARDLFRALYERTHDPRALVRQGLAEMALSEWVNAETHLTEGKETRGNRWVDENRPRIEDALREVQTHLGSLAVECGPRGAVVYIDDAARATCPVERPMRMPVGSVRVRVQAPGMDPRSETVTLSAGTTPSTVRLALTPPTLAPAADEVAAAESNNRRRSTLRALGFTALGLGVAGIGAGVAGYAVTGDDGQPLSETMGILGLAAGGTLLVTGVVLLVAAPARREVPGAQAFVCAPWLHGLGGGCAFAF
jgi:hypothetical protein